MLAAFAGACDTTSVELEAVKTKSAIMYGNPSVRDSILVTDTAEKKMHVFIQGPTFECSGVVLTADYVLSARHCFAATGSDTPKIAASSIKVFREGKGDGTNFASVDKIILTPSADLVDAALLKLVSPFSSVGSATQAVLAPRTDSAVLGQNVTCYGFGNSFNYVGLTKGNFTTDKYWDSIPEVTFKRNPEPPFAVPGDSGGGCFKGRDLIGILAGVEIGTGVVLMEPAWRFANLITDNDCDAVVPEGGTTYTSRVLVKWDGSPPPQGSVSIDCDSVPSVSEKVDTNNAGTWYRAKCLGTKSATIRCSTGGSPGWSVRSFYQDTDAGPQPLPIQNAKQAEYRITNLPESSELRFGCEFQGPNARVAATGMETLGAEVAIYHYDGETFKISEVNGNNMSSLPAAERARLLRVGTGINAPLGNNSAWVYCGTNGAPDRKVANVYTEWSSGDRQTTSCEEAGCWAEVPVSADNFARCNFAPLSWSCSNSWYGTHDGCDCGCGGTDPDCGDGGCTTSGCSALSCDYFW
jgi:hypothetical protein